MDETAALIEAALSEQRQVTTAALPEGFSKALMLHAGTGRLRVLLSDASGQAKEVWSGGESNLAQAYYDALDG